MKKENLEQEQTNKDYLNNRWEYIEDLNDQEISQYMDKIPCEVWD